MSHPTFLASLNLGTLLIGLAIAAVALIYFLRRRSNRHPLKGHAERNVGKDLDEGAAAPDHSPRK